MKTVKVLPKGQITISKRLREKLGIKKVLFDIAGIIQIKESVSIEDLIEEARRRIGTENV